MKPEPCRQHSTISLIEYQNQYPKIWIIPEEIKFYQKMIPKNREHPKKVPKNPGAPPKIPKIMAHPRIATYASPPLPPPRDSRPLHERLHAGYKACVGDKWKTFRSELFRGHNNQISNKISTSLIQMRFQMSNFVH